MNLVTIPSGPNTDDGILSNESDRDFVSADCSCKLHLYQECMTHLGKSHSI